VVTLSNSTNSIDPSTGALVLSQGSLGVTGNINLNGQLNFYTAGTGSTGHVSLTDNYGQLIISSGPAGSGEVLNQFTGLRVLSNGNSSQSFITSQFGTPGGAINDGTVLQRYQIYHDSHVGCAGYSAIWDNPNTAIRWKDDPAIDSWSINRVYYDKPVNFTQGTTTTGNVNLLNGTTTSTISNTTSNLVQIGPTGASLNVQGPSISLGPTGPALFSINTSATGATGSITLAGDGTMAFHQRGNFDVFEDTTSTVNPMLHVTPTTITFGNPNYANSPLSFGWAATNPVITATGLSTQINVSNQLHVSGNVNTDNSVTASGSVNANSGINTAAPGNGSLTTQGGCGVLLDARI